MNLENQLAKTNPSVLLKIPRAQICVNIKVINQSLRYHDGYVRKNASHKVNGRSFNLHFHYSNFLTAKCSGANSPGVKNQNS